MPRAKVIGSLAILAATLQVPFPSPSRVSWMRPESFHLMVGMNRQEAVKKLEDNGWKPKKGADADHLVVDYTDEKALTLEFRRNRLCSIRFELFAFLPAIHD